MTLNDAYIKYAKEKAKDSYAEFLLCFFMSAKESCNVNVPTDINDQGMNYCLVNTTDGPYYIVCTNADELCKCLSESSVIVTLDKMLVRMLNDSDVKGICVNPYGDFPCFIPQEYARRVVDTGNTQ